MMDDELDREKVVTHSRRLDEISRSVRRRKALGSLLIAVGMFLVVATWVLLGLTITYVVIAFIGSSLFGLGAYYLLTEPPLRTWFTLSEELDMILSETEDPEELRNKVRDALKRHKDEPMLSQRVETILSNFKSEEIKKALKELISSYRRIG
ncbi:MAG: hypothetical protein RMI85_04380 [Candidatus Korarchaeum sp.]|nr:hypothetical protein [Candidatus Korarchaeum sp.]